jgi:hypothetical protein
MRTESDEPDGTDVSQFVVEQYRSDHSCLQARIGETRRCVVRFLRENIGSFEVRSKANQHALSFIRKLQLSAAHTRTDAPTVSRILHDRTSHLSAA